MRTYIIRLLTLLLLSSNTYATLYPEAKPCNPSAFGTFCEINPKARPSKKYKHIAYCGGTQVYLTKRQKDALDAYLEENKNMVLRMKVDDEYINAPCF